MTTAAALPGAIVDGKIPPQGGIAACVALPAVVFFNETVPDNRVSKVFSLEPGRTGCIALKSILDRRFGERLAAPGPKIAIH